MFGEGFKQLFLHAIYAHRERDFWCVCVFKSA